MSPFFCWSGGKDSMPALHRALAAGHAVRALLAMFDELLALGCRARAVCVDARLPDADFCGREVEPAPGRCFVAEPA